MAELKKTLILEIDAETGEVTGQLDALNQDLDKTGDKAEAVGTKGAKGMKALSGGLKLAGKGFGMLGKAIAATGLGAIVLVVGLVIKKLSELKPVMDVVEKATAFLGGALKAVTDLLEPLGEWLLAAFSDPQQAMQDMKQVLEDIWNWYTSIYKFIGNKFMGAIKKLQASLIEARISWNEFFGDDKEAEALKQRLDEVNKQIDEYGAAAEQNKETFVAPFKAAAEYIETTLIPAMVANGEAAVDLKNKQIALRDAQRELNLEYATSRSEIAQLKKDSDDLSLSIEDRVAAAQAAAAMEEELRAKRQALIESEIGMLLEEQAIQGENEERTQRINELKIEQQAIIEEGLGIQTEMMTKTQGLQREQLDAEKAFAQAQADRRDANKAEQAQELQEIADHYAEQLLLAEQYGLDTTDLLKQQIEEVEDLQEAHRLADLAEEKKLREAKLQMTLDALGALQALNEAFSLKSIKDQEREAALRKQIDETDNAAKKNALIKKLNDEQALETQSQKKAFDRGKALQISQALISTYLGASKAYTSQLIPGDPTSPIRAAIAAGIAVTSGLAQVASIKKQKFDAPAPMPFVQPASASESGGDAVSAASASAPELDLSFLGDGAQNNVQAYVISNEVTTTQQSDQLIADQASLVA